MSRFPGRRRPDPEAAALVRRTLADVAASLAVPDDRLRPLADGASPHALPSGEAAGGGRPRRSRLLVAAATAAVAGLAATGVWAAERGSGEGPDGDGGADAGVVARPPTPDAYPAAGWLPDGLDPAAPTQVDGERPPGLQDAVLAVGPGADDALVAIRSVGTPAALQSAGDEVGRTINGEAVPDGPYTTATSVGAGGTQRAVVARAGAEVDDALLTRALDVNGALSDVADGTDWRAERFDLGWIPGLGTSRTSAFERTAGGERVARVSLSAVQGYLPDADDLAAFLSGEERATVHGRPAWAYPTRDGTLGGTAVVWREAPGVVGFVEALGVGADDAVRIAEAGSWPERVAAPPAGGAEAPAYAWADATSADALCDARPEGTAAPPAEEEGTAVTGLVGLTGADDRPYELLLWQDRTVDGGREATADCWRLRLEDGPELRGGGPWPGDMAVGVEQLAPVAWTADEAVFFAAAPAGTVFTASDGDLQSTVLEPATADGVEFTFLTVARGGPTEVTFTAHGGSTGDLGPFPLDGSPGPEVPDL